MNVACFIPIKENSERVKGKNFKLIGNKPLYQIIIDKAIEAEVFDVIYVDTNSKEISNYALEVGVEIIERKPELAENSANGNDLLVYHLKEKPNHDIYFQLFATAPLIKVETIRNCVKKLLLSTSFDSVFTARKQNGFFWWSGQPVNYQPVLLPRSQDLVPVMEETTALYGIQKATLNRYHCRIGAKPFAFEVSKMEAVDLNIEDDFHYVNWLVETGKVHI